MVWEYFPDNYTWTLATWSVLDGGGNINEVDEACRPLKELAKLGVAPMAQEAWYESWKRVAERVEKLGAADEAAGHPLSAGRKYMRAYQYYVAAERMMTNLDARKLQTYKQMLNCFKKGVQLRRDPVEFVEVPYEGTTLPSLFVPALGEGPAPCIIHFNGFDGYKEGHLYPRIGTEYRRRGVAVLMVDHPGVGEALRLKNLPARYDMEVPAAACLDYLETRSDVDPERIGIQAQSLGSYYAPRAAAFEKRLKCCVSWGAGGGLISRRERMAKRDTSHASVPDFQLLWVFGKDTVEEALEIADKMTLIGILDKITCPLLVVAGENDRQSPLWCGEKVIEGAVNSPMRKLKVLTVEEGGAEHCAIGHAAMAVDYMADWVAEVLGGNPKGV